MKAALELLKEMWQFIREEKIWWIAPILLILVFLSVFIVLTEGSALLPFLYTLF